MPTNKQYEEFIAHLPVAASDRTLMALKGHLLVEQALRTFIESRVSQPCRIKDKQIQFSALVDFASSLAKIGELDWLWSALKTLNQLRNTLAHNLSPQKTEEIEEKFVNHVKNHDGELSVFEGSSKLKYGEFSLAVFQVYDVLLSASHSQIIESTPLKHAGSSEETQLSKRSNDKISVAITKAFLTIESKQFRDGTHGPAPRRKWSKHM
ncbi:hypothetical protein [Pseudomonas prosekii]|uniref:hypothetical protein n=1 Tax=Pseudomonas prosekii TaxID=1148509 RepID=UPI0011EB15F7|nr:hypothetical protein [Pseudomonas prosekii]